MKKLMTICVLVTLMLPAGAWATLTAVGDAFESGSWSQQWNESGAGNFDLIAATVISAGDTLEHDALYGFSNASWALLYENDASLPTIASASGDSLTSLNFYTRFAGDKGPLTMCLVAFNGDTIVDSVQATYNGGWSYAACDWTPARSDVVPEPATLALLGLGALFFRKTKRA